MADSVEIQRRWREKNPTYHRDLMRIRTGVVCRPCSCEWCAGDVWGRKRTYCSPGCRVAFQKFQMWLRYQAKREPRVCKMCLVEFEPPNLNRGYCSSGCLSRARACLSKGVSLQRFREMWSAQGGRCAICRDSLSDPHLTHLDHSHAEKNGRGILCQSCNLCLGHARDDPRRVRAMIAYLEQPSLLAVA